MEPCGLGARGHDAMNARVVEASRSPPSSVLPRLPPDDYLPVPSLRRARERSVVLTAESTRIRPARERTAPASRVSRRAARRRGVAQHQHHPRARDGRGRGGAVGPPGHPDGAGARPRTSCGTASSSTIRRHPDWPDRDRFVLSCGHASMLLYALLHLTGYDVSLDDLRAFRQWGSRDAGPSRARTHAGRGDHHRPAGPGRRQRGRHGDRRAPAGRAVQPAGPPDRRPSHLGLRERRRPDGGRRRTRPRRSPVTCGSASSP